VKKLIKFTIADIRNIVRDPMQTLTAAAPLIIIVVLRIFLSVAREQVIQFFDYDIISDYPIIISFFSLLIPMMVGLVIGFIILDERDESMINYYAVTPLTKRGYLVFRMTVPIVFTFLVSVVFYLALYDIYAINMLNLLIVSMLLALQSPVFSFLMASFASNKVEGLAIGKLLGMMIVPPIANYFIVSKWSILFFIVPQTWVSAIITGKNIGFLNLPMIVFCALLIHISIIIFCIRIFVKKVDGS